MNDLLVIPNFSKDKVKVVSSATTMQLRKHYGMYKIINSYEINRLTHRFYYNRRLQSELMKFFFSFVNEPKLRKSNVLWGDPILKRFYSDLKADYFVVNDFETKRGTEKRISIHRGKQFRNDEEIKDYFEKLGENDRQIFEVIYWEISESIISYLKQMFKKTEKIFYDKLAKQFEKLFEISKDEKYSVDDWFSYTAQRLMKEMENPDFEKIVVEGNEIIKEKLRRAKNE